MTHISHNPSCQDLFFRRKPLDNLWHILRLDLKVQHFTAAVFSFALYDNGRRTLLYVRNVFDLKVFVRKNCVSDFYFQPAVL